MLGWLALCNWRGSGEQNGMRIDKRDVYEQDRNKIGIETIRPQAPKNPIITKDSEGKQRGMKAST